LSKPLSFSLASNLIVSKDVTSRTYYISIGNARSEMHSFDRGCPQGSFLGPILFGMYFRDVTMSVKAKMLSYAEDSYVSCTGNGPREAIESLAENVKSHTAYLT